MSRKIAGSAAAQNHRVGRKAKAFSFADLRREIDAGFRHFTNKRPVRPMPGIPHKAPPK